MIILKNYHYSFNYLYNNRSLFFFLNLLKLYKVSEKLNTIKLIMFQMSLFINLRCGAKIKLI